MSSSLFPQRTVGSQVWLTGLILVALLIGGCAPVEKVDSSPDVASLACDPAWSETLPLGELTVAVRGNAGPMLAWGEEQGCFAEHGLTVAVTEVADDAASVAGLVSESWDVVSFTPFAMVQAVANSGVELVTAAPWYGYTEEELTRARQEPLFEGELLLSMATVTANPNVESWADLVGKVVSVPSAGGVAEANLRAALVANAGESATATVVVLPPAEALAALERKDIDAAVLTGLRAIQAIEAGASVVGYPGAYFYEAGPANIFVTHRKIANQDSRIAAFQDAILHINELLNTGEHSESYTRIIIEDFEYSQEVADEILSLRLDTKPLVMDDFLYLVPKMKAQRLIPAEFQLAPSMFLGG